MDKVTWGGYKLINKDATLYIHEDGSQAKSMVEPQRNCLRDYKFYCFNGEPKLLYVSEGLEDHSTAKISFLNIDWTFANFNRSDYRPYDELPEKPHNYDQMLRIAAKLAEGFQFLRVDLYEIDEKVYFSELTFSPCGGFLPFKPSQADKEVGELLKLDF